MNKIICFDVDGVLIDSNDEIMLSSWNEYNAWLDEIGMPAQPFSISIDDVPDTFRTARNALGKKSHKGYYRTAINLFALAGFDPNCVSMELIRQVSEADPKLKAKTMTRVKSVRERLLREGELSSLVRRYDDVDYDWIETKNRAGELYLITNNAFSIEGLKAVAFTPDSTYVRGPYGETHDKAMHINEICNTSGVACDQLLFIDDSEAALQDVQQGTSLPNKNILQNQWCNKPRAQGFPCLGWQAIVDQYEVLYTQNS